jgi:group I intron endonuclease
MTCGIYSLINKTNGRQYIGSSTNIEARFIQHREMLDLNRHHSSKLQNAWNEYGTENFLFEHLQVGSFIPLELEVLEYISIKTENSFTKGYNMTEDTSRENSGMYEFISKIYKKQLEAAAEEVGYNELKKSDKEKRKKVGLFGKVGEKLDKKIDYDNGFFLFLAASFIVLWAFITVIPLLLMNPFVAIWNAFGGKSKITATKEKALKVAETKTVREFAQRFANIEGLGTTDAQLAANYFFRIHSSSFYIYGPH